MLDLKPLTQEQLPLLQVFLTTYPRESCDFSVCNLLTWGKIYGNLHTVWRDHLVIVNPKYSYLFHPIGPGLSAADLRELMAEFQETDPEAELILIPENWQDSVPGLDRYFDIRIERDWADYVYDVDRMVNLSGKKLAKKKNLVSQYRRNYPDYKVLRIKSGNCATVSLFTQKWKRERNAEGIYLNTELTAIRNTLEMWDSLPIEGIIICHHNLISAYSIFSQQTADMATIHFEKFDPDMKGSAQIVNWETARALQGRYRWINREQDMGLEGLRQAKLSYMPDRMLGFLLGKPLG